MAKSTACGTTMDALTAHRLFPSHQREREREMVRLTCMNRHTNKHTSLITYKDDTKKKAYLFELYYVYQGVKALAFFTLTVSCCGQIKSGEKCVYVSSFRFFLILLLQQADPLACSVLSHTGRYSPASLDWGVIISCTVYYYYVSRFLFAVLNLVVLLV